MNRADLKRLAQVRIQEAKVLLNEGLYDGAYYLAGYAVECALKACIAKQTQKYDFPDKQLANNVFSHNLEDLAKYAKLKVTRDDHAKANTSFSDNWNTVKDWVVESRYTSNVPEQKARDLYRAITHTKDGVLPWLKKYW